MQCRHLSVYLICLFTYCYITYLLSDAYCYVGYPFASNTYFVVDIRMLTHIHLDIRCVL